MAKVLCQATFRTIGMKADRPSLSRHACGSNVSWAAEQRRPISLSATLLILSAGLLDEAYAPILIINVAGIFFDVCARIPMVWGFQRHDNIFETARIVM